MPKSPVKFFIFIREFLGYAAFLFANLFIVILGAFVLLISFPFPKIKRFLIAKPLMYTLRFLLFTLDILAVSKVKICGRQNIKSGAIYVANHRSFLDPIIMLASIPNSVALMKDKYSRLLAIRFLVKFFDFLALGKSSPEALQKTKEKAEKLLADGVSIIIFPEGTRSKSGRIQDFKNFAFKLAISTNAPLISSAIFQKGSLLTPDKNSYFPDNESEYYFSMLQAATPADFKNANALSNNSYNQIAKELKRLENDTE